MQFLERPAVHRPDAVVSAPEEIGDEMASDEATGTSNQDPCVRIERGHRVSGPISRDR